MQYHCESTGKEWGNSKPPVYWVNLFSPPHSDAKTGTEIRILCDPSQGLWVVQNPFSEGGSKEIRSLKSLMSWSTKPNNILNVTQNASLCLGHVPRFNNVKGPALLSNSPINTSYVIPNYISLTLSWDEGMMERRIHEDLGKDNCAALWWNAFL